MIDNSDSKSWFFHKMVLPQHVDHAGVMWHGTYVNFLEEARVEALHKVGLPYKQLSDAGFEMPVVSLEIEYLNVVNLGDQILLESKCLQRNRARWPWMTKFIRGGETVANAKVELVLVEKCSGKQNLIRNVPKEILNYLDKIQHYK